MDEFELFERVERLTPEVLRTVKGVCHAIGRW